MNQTVANWIALAQYDLKSAAVLLAGGQYLTVAFELQQAVEKLLKGIYLKNTGKEAPYIHHLARLMDLAGVTPLLTNAQRTVIVKLSEYYQEVRYSEEIEMMVQHLTKENTEAIFTETIELCN